MKKKQLLLSILGLLFLLYSNPSIAQEEKFGKISEEIFKMTSYDKDPDASALILFDIGNLSYIYDAHDNSFDNIYRRHRRVKIFNKNGYNEANVEIPVYEKDVFISFKAAIFKSENGKIVKYELGKDAIFKEQVVDGYSIRKITFPQITEGVVIEYEYEIRSESIILRDWYFQESIPCLWSEYNCAIPEYFIYKEVVRGGGIFDFYLNEQKITQGQFIFYEKQVNYNLTERRLVMKSVPAFKEERFISTISEYIPSIEIVLTNIEYTFVLPNYYATLPTIWDRWIALILDEESFGGRIRDIDEISEYMPNLEGVVDEMAKINRIYEYVRNNIKYNGTNSLYASKSVKETFENKVGNIADINLILIAMLRKAGYDALPFLISTRENGLINYYFPSYKKPNYLIACVLSKGNLFFMDASDPFLVPGLLPISCFNGSGILIRNNKSNVVSIGMSYESTISENMILKLNEEGKLVGEMQILENGLNMVEARRGLQQNGEENYFNSRWREEFKNFSISSFSIANDKEINAMITNLRFKGEEVLDGEKIYIEPIVLKTFHENPFKEESRLYPVQFDKREKNNYTLNFTIPKGYDLEEMPKGMMLTLLDDKAKYTYVAGRDGNTLQIRITLKFFVDTFYPADFSLLKQFINQIITKESEQIVLKKISNSGN